MKEKVLIFIMGLLVGAIITAGGFFAYTKLNKKDNTQQINGNQPPMMQNGRDNFNKRAMMDEQGNIKKGNRKSDNVQDFRQRPDNSGNEQNNGGTPPEISSNDNKATPTQSESDNTI